MSEGLKTVTFTESHSLREVVEAAARKQGMFTLKDIAGLLDWIGESFNDITGAQKLFLPHAEDDETLKEISRTALDVLDTANAMRLDG